MALSLSKKNVLSIMAMTLTMISLISPADSKTTCSSTSPDCCWVVESWKKMGGKTSASSTDATACCYYLGSTTQNSGIPGVRCSSSGIVTEIIWMVRSLQGRIPSEIGNLVNLKVLSLGYNQLSGPIPSSLGNLANLQRLELPYNQLSGSIPSSLGNLANLKGLQLSKNQLSGPIPSFLGNLVNLQSLDLGFNQLSGSIPSSLGNLANLQKQLGLNNNQLSGSIPSSLGNLVNLLGLSLGYNQLSGSIPSSLGNLPNLQWLYLHNNPGLTGTLTLQCGTNVDILGTKVTICGCVAESTPPALYPPPEIDDDCLASRHALSLSKRSQVYGQVVAQIGNLIFKCHVDNARNPFADCLNSMAALCDPARTLYDKGTCKTAVNQMYGQMSEYWQKVRKACGRWSWTQDGITYTGEVYTSDNCVSANKDLIANAYYSVWNPLTNAYENIKVTSGLTDSTNVGLWGQVAE